MAAAVGNRRRHSFKQGVRRGTGRGALAGVVVVVFEKGRATDRQGGVPT